MVFKKEGFRRLKNLFSNNVQNKIGLNINNSSQILTYFFLTKAGLSKAFITAILLFL